MFNFIENYQCICKNLVHHFYNSNFLWCMLRQNTKTKFSLDFIIKKFQFLQISMGTCINLTTVIVSTTDIFFAPSQASQTVCKMCQNMG